MSIELVIDEADAILEREEREKNTRIITIPFSEIEPKALNWLWKGVIPMGKLTLIVGDPGLGKSLMTLDIASRISRGLKWPDDSACQEGHVFILSAEDDPADTIRPRLDALGADVEKIELIKAVCTSNNNGKKEHSFNLDADIAYLESRLQERIDNYNPIRLLIIDPISAYLGNTETHVNASVRSLLTPLAKLAADYDLAILAVSHLNKSNAPAIYRTTGSLAFTAAARAVWLVAKDSENENRILFMPIKQNLSKNNGGFAYSIESSQGNGLPIIVWEKGRVIEDVNSLLQTQNPEDRAQWKEAYDWLKERLSNGEYVPAKEIYKEAYEFGISKDVLKKASRKLKVIKEKEGFQGAWTWRLPSKGVDTSKECKECSPIKLTPFEDTGSLWEEKKI